MYKSNLIAATFAASALLAALPLASQEIVVSPRSSVNFVTEVSRDLQKQIDREHFDTRWASSGLAQVRFEAGADGRPINVRTYRKSGDMMLDLHARRIVKRLSSLYPLPDGVRPGQVIQANILVAKSPRHMHELRETLAREEAARIASSPAERAVLALTNIPASAS